MYFVFKFIFQRPFQCTDHKPVLRFVFKRIVPPLQDSWKVNICTRPLKILIYLIYSVVFILSFTEVFPKQVYTGGGFCQGKNMEAAAFKSRKKP